MLNKINGPAPEAAVSATICSVAFETLDKETVVSPADLKREVANYKDVMVTQLKIPASAFFQAVPINLDHVREFLDSNQGAKGMRIYFAKKSTDKNQEDYHLIFVPCSLIEKEQGTVVYYEDMGVNVPVPPGGPAFITTFECRKPPGCGQGALLL